MVDKPHDILPCAAKPLKRPARVVCEPSATLFIVERLSSALTRDKIRCMLEIAAGNKYTRAHDRDSR